MVEVSRSVSLPRNLRRMNPLRDWSAVTRLMQVAFQTDVTNPGLPLRPRQGRWVTAISRPMA